jgi:hypothetical protein
MEPQAKCHTIIIAVQLLSYNNEYLPIMITPPGNIGIVRQQDKFNFQFDNKNR